MDRKLLIATIIFFASHLGTVAALAFLARKMWEPALISYIAGWGGWGVAFVIGGEDLIKKRKKYRKLLKQAIKWIFK